MITNFLGEKSMKTPTGYKKSEIDNALKLVTVIKQSQSIAWLHGPLLMYDETDGNIHYDVWENRVEITFDDVDKTTLKALNMPFIPKNVSDMLTITEDAIILQKLIFDSLTEEQYASIILLIRELRVMKRELSL